MLRTIIVLGIFGVCTGAGISAARKLQLRLETLRMLSIALNKLTMRMDYTRQPLPMLVLRCETEQSAPLFELFSYALTAERNSANAWQVAMEAACVQNRGLASLQQPEMDALYEYASCLGEGDYAAQDKNAAYLRKEFEPILEQAQDEYTRKGRMYRSMGLLCGIAFSILLI